MFQKSLFASVESNPKKAQVFITIRPETDLKGPARFMILEPGISLLSLYLQK